MKFRNPWIDPRVTQVRPEDAQAYLLRRGWKPLGPAVNPSLTMYEGPGEGEKVTTVLLPQPADDGAMLQRMIELVGEVALFEKRYAVDVLNDILSGQARAEPNGVARGEVSETGVRP